MGYPAIPAVVPGMTISGLGGDKPFHEPEIEHQIEQHVSFVRYAQMDNVVRFVDFNQDGLWIESANEAKRSDYERR